MKLKILIIILAIICCIFNQFNKLQPKIYLNLTSSLPKGLYLVKNKAPEINDLVVIDLPNDKRTLLLKQGIKFTGLLLKKIVATHGDYVCSSEDKILINDNIKLIKNKSFNLYSICRTLTNQEFFVALDNRDNSLDSRYFGVVTAQHIKAVVKALITL